MWEQTQETMMAYVASYYTNYALSLAALAGLFYTL
jgi:hypothetical protein